MDRPDVEGALARAERGENIYNHEVATLCRYVKALETRLTRADAEIGRLTGEAKGAEGWRRLVELLGERRVNPACRTCGGSGCAPDGSTCDCYGWYPRALALPATEAATRSGRP